MIANVLFQVNPLITPPWFYKNPKRGRSIEQGLRYGKLGLKLYEKFKNEAWFCRVMTIHYGLVASAKEPMSMSLEPLQCAYRAGLRTGDIEYAMVGSAQCIWVFSVYTRFSTLHLFVLDGWNHVSV